MPSILLTLAIGTPLVRITVFAKVSLVRVKVMGSGVRFASVKAFDESVSNGVLPASIGPSQLLKVSTPVVVPAFAIGITPKRMYFPISEGVSVYVVLDAPLIAVPVPEATSARYHLKVEVPCASLSDRHTHKTLLKQNQKPVFLQ